MTHVWPGRGEAPVPTWVSMICNPEGVVTVFPTSCAVAVPGSMPAQPPVSIATRASAVIARAKTRILISCDPVDLILPDPNWQIGVRVDFRIPPVSENGL